MPNRRGEYKTQIGQDIIGTGFYEIGPFPSTRTRDRQRKGVIDRRYRRGETPIQRLNARLKLEGSRYPRAMPILWTLSERSLSRWQARSHSARANRALKVIRRSSRRYLCNVRELTAIVLAVELSVGCLPATSIDPNVACTSGSCLVRVSKSNVRCFHLAGC